MKHITRLFILLSLILLAFNGTPAPVSAQSLGGLTRLMVGSQEFDNGVNSASISKNGRYVVFVSDSTNLVPNDTNLSADVFVYDNEIDVISRISINSTGQQANGWSNFAVISGDGRYVVFNSFASNLVVNDTNDSEDLFAHDRQTGQTTRISLDYNGNELPYFSSSWWFDISYDGRYIAFDSYSDAHVSDDTNGDIDVFVYDQQTAEITRVSVDSDGNQTFGGLYPQLSDDGRYVLFSSGASDLVPNDTNNEMDVFVHDRQTGETTRVSVDSNGNQLQSTGLYVTAGQDISSDGRYVVFETTANNLVPNDTTSTDKYDTFVHDRQTGQTTRISVGTGDIEGNGDSGQGRVSNDGRYVFFVSDSSNLVANDTNDAVDVFMRDLQTGVTTRISVDGAGNQSNDDSTGVSLSSDMRYIMLESDATNLVTTDTNGARDVFIIERPIELLPAPNLIAPSNSSTQFNPRIYFRWNVVSGASQYRIQIATDNTFTTPIHEYIVTTDDYDYILLYAGTFYWRVQAGNINNQFGHWSSVYSFTQPSITLTQPINDFLTNGDNIFFSWNSFSSATSYQIQISTDDDFTNIIHEQELDELDYSYTLSVIGDYYWRVRAISSGIYLQWSEIRKITVISTQSPILELPVNGMITVNPLINFSWLPVDETPSGTYYRIQVSATSDFSSIVFTSSPSSTSSSFTANTFGTFYWRVRTNYSSWSDVYQFTIEPLSQPTLLNPSDGQIFSHSVAATANFDWSDVPNPTTRQVIYHFQLATDENFSTNIYDATSTTSLRNGLPLYGDETTKTYYWRVCARFSNQTCLIWSDIFEIVVEPMYAPQLTLPINGYSSQNSVVDFEWDNRQVGGWIYDDVIQVALDSDFNYIVYEDNVFPFSREQATATLPPNTYYWRTRKFHNWQNVIMVYSPWSEVNQFTIEQLSAPQLTSPTNYWLHYNTFITFPLKFIWATVNHAWYHEFQLATDSDFNHILVEADIHQYAYPPEYSVASLGYGEYYWRVRAVYDSSERVNVSEWSEVYHFSLVNYHVNRGITSRVSLASNNGQANSSSGLCDISVNGRYVLFESSATNLNLADRTISSDIYVRDRQTNQTSLISMNSQGIVGNQVSNCGAISSDGRYVVFESRATNLVSNDTNGFRDIFLHDRMTLQTTRLSINAQGIEGNANSFDADISANGRYVVFTSDASNLVPDDNNGKSDVFLYDIQTGQIVLVSSGILGIGNDRSHLPSITNDGRYVLFSSSASNFVTIDNDSVEDMYLKDMQTGELTLQSINYQGNKFNGLGFHQISGNGQHIVFLSNADNVTPIRYYTTGVYVRDIQSGQVTLVTIPYNLIGFTPPELENFYAPSISDDGRFIAFATRAGIIPIGSARTQAYRYDTVSQQTIRMSVSTDGVHSPETTGVLSSSSSTRISGDGTVGAFSSSDVYLVPNDTNNSSDVFVMQFNPSIPELLLPNDTTVTTISNVSFTWGNALTATGYRVQIATDSDFNNVLYDENVIANTYTQNLAPNTYYWRVRATNSIGESTWSDIYELTIVMAVNSPIDEQQLFNMAQPMLANGMTFALFDVTPTGIITTTQFDDGGVVTGNIRMTVQNGLLLITVDGLSGGSTAQQDMFRDSMPAMMMNMLDEMLPDNYLAIEMVTMSDVGLDIGLVMPNP